MGTLLKSYYLDFPIPLSEVKVTVRNLVTQKITCPSPICFIRNCPGICTSGKSFSLTFSPSCSLLHSFFPFPFHLSIHRSLVPSFFSHVATVFFLWFYVNAYIFFCIDKKSLLKVFLLLLFSWWVTLSSLRP